MSSRLRLKTSTVLGCQGYARRIDRKSIPSSRRGLNLAYRRTERLAQSELVLLKFTSAVTNTRFARSTGFRSALSPSRPRPFLCANRVLVTICILLDRMSGVLPSAARRRGVALRLRSARRSSPLSAPLSPPADRRPKPVFHCRGGRDTRRDSACCSNNSRVRPTSAASADSLGNAVWYSRTSILHPKPSIA